MPGKGKNAPKNDNKPTSTQVQPPTKAHKATERSLYSYIKPEQILKPTSVEKYKRTRTPDDRTLSPSDRLTRITLFFDVLDDDKNKGNIILANLNSADAPFASGVFGGGETWEDGDSYSVNLDVRTPVTYDSCDLYTALMLIYIPVDFPDLFRFNVTAFLEFEGGSWLRMFASNVELALTPQGVAQPPVVLIPWK
jgi:hypothetical protein